MSIFFYRLPLTFILRFLFFVILLSVGPLVFNGKAFAQTAEESPVGLKKLSLEELMNMDVTSVSKQPEPYSQAPAAIDVILGDEIRRSGASSIPEALRLADNLEVAKKSSNGWAVSARGFNTDFGNKLLVLMDGRCLYTPLFSGVFWDAQDYLLEDISRIEVISGPGGTLWGANAVNGVINITSKSAQETQGFYWEEGGGSDMGNFVGARYGGALAPDIFFRVYGKYFYREGEVFADGTDALDSWKMGRGGFRVDAEPSSNDSFTLHGDHYDGEEDQTSFEQTQLGGSNVVGRWSHTFSPDSDMSLQLYWDRTTLSLPKPAGAFAGAGILVDALDTYDLDFQHHFHLGKGQNWIWGLGYRLTHDEVQNAPSVAFIPAILEHQLFNVFVQDEVGLIESLSLTLGSKVEHNDYTGYEFEPSARLQWNVAENQMIWSAVSRAIRAPSRVDRDERVPTPVLVPFGIDNLLVGGADFESETLMAYELGYRSQVTRNLSTSLSLYYNVYDDIRSTRPVGPPDLLVFANDLAGETYGAELTADYQVLEGWRLHGGYDYLKENLWVKDDQVDFSNQLNETADPRNQLFFRSSMDLPGDLELDGAFRWVDSLIYNDNQKPGTVPSYAELDIRLGWHPVKHIEVSLAGQNLLQDHHLEYVISGSDQKEEVQRSIYGKVALQF